MVPNALARFRQIRLPEAFVLEFVLVVIHFNVFYSNFILHIIKKYLQKLKAGIIR